MGIECRNLVKITGEEEIVESCVRVAV